MNMGKSVIFWLLLLCKRVDVFLHALIKWLFDCVALQCERGWERWRKTDKKKFLHETVWDSWLGWICIKLSILKAWLGIGPLRSEVQRQWVAEVVVLHMCSSDESLGDAVEQCPSLRQSCSDTESLNTTWTSGGNYLIIITNTVCYSHKVSQGEVWSRTMLKCSLQPVGRAIIKLSYLEPFDDDLKCKNYSAFSCALPCFPSELQNK